MLKSSYKGHSQKGLLKMQNTEIHGNTEKLVEVNWAKVTSTDFSTRKVRFYALLCFRVKTKKPENVVFSGFCALLLWQLVIPLGFEPLAHKCLELYCFVGLCCFGELLVK